MAFSSDKSFHYRKRSLLRVAIPAPAPGLYAFFVWAVQFPRGGGVILQRKNHTKYNKKYILQ